MSSCRVLKFDFVEFDNDEEIGIIIENIYPYKKCHAINLFLLTSIRILFLINVTETYFYPSYKIEL